MNELIEWLTDPQQRFEEVTPYEFYRDVFPDGELDVAGAKTKGKYTGIAIAISPTEKVTFKLMNGETRKKPAASCCIRPCLPNLCR